MGLSAGDATFGLPEQPPPGSPKSSAGPGAPLGSVGVTGASMLKKKKVSGDGRPSLPGQQQQQPQQQQRKPRPSNATSAGRSSAAGHSALDDNEDLEEVKQLREAEQLLALKHQKYARECAQQPVPSSSASHRGGSSLVAAIWQDFAHVMRAPPDPAAEEAALARHAGKHAQLGDGPLWWNSVAAQNHAAQMRTEWIAEDNHVGPRAHGPGGIPGRTGNSGMPGITFQRYNPHNSSISNHAGRHKKRDVPNLSGHGTITGEALQSYMDAARAVTDGYYKAQEDLIEKAAQVVPLRQLRAYNGAEPTSHLREFKASTHIHDSVETAVKNGLTRSSAIGGGTTEAKMKNLEAMRTSERIRPKLKFETMPGLPEPHTGTKTSMTSSLGGADYFGGAGASKQPAPIWSKHAGNKILEHKPVAHGSSIVQSKSLKDGRVIQKDWLRLQSGKAGFG